jgi:hypothetical protein
MRLGTRRVRALLVAACCLIVPAVGAAQSPPSVPAFVPDRPDFTESSEVVGHRVVQLETGVRLEQIDQATRQISTPQMLVRVGFGSRAEVRLALDGYVAQSVRTAAGNVRVSGRSDVEVSTKVKLLAGDATWLHVAVLPFLSLPTATQGLGSAGYDSGVTVAWARELPWDVELSGNVNASSIAAEVGRTWKRELSVSAGRGLGRGWGAYWEAYGAVGDGRCECSVDAGVSLAIGANSQIDVEAGRGVSGPVPHWFIGVGFAMRRLSGNPR